MSPETPASFHRRPLPDGLIAFSSPEGRVLFREALDAGGMEGWWGLMEHFHTQADPAYCGLGSLVVALNALSIDPGRLWKGPWRWFSEEMLDCCLSLERVRAEGVTLDQLGCLARCNGADARVVHAADSDLESLRAAIAASCETPDGPRLVAAYGRRPLGQTGDGHASPIGGWHAGSQRVLILDVARFKYPPHWVPLDRLWAAMCTIDPVSGRTRGWLTLRRDPAPRSLDERLADWETACQLTSP